MSRSVLFYLPPNSFPIIGTLANGFVEFVVVTLADLLLLPSFSVDAAAAYV
jgi:hypothetical protein